MCMMRMRKMDLDVYDDGEKKSGKDLWWIFVLLRRKVFAQTKKRSSWFILLFKIPGMFQRIALWWLDTSQLQVYKMFAYMISMRCNLFAEIIHLSLVMNMFLVLIRSLISTWDSEKTNDKTKRNSICTKKFMELCFIFCFA